MGLGELIPCRQVEMVLTCANKLYTYMGIDFFEVLRCCELDKVTNSTFEYQSTGVIQGAGVRKGSFLRRGM